MKSFTIELGDSELPIFRRILERDVDLAKNCAQLSMTTTAEREIYRQNVDVAQAVIDQLP